MHCFPTLPRPAVDFADTIPKRLTKPASPSQQSTLLPDLLHEGLSLIFAAVARVLDYGHPIRHRTMLLDRMPAVRLSSPTGTRRGLHKFRSRRRGKGVPPLGAWPNGK